MSTTKTQPHGVYIDCDNKITTMDVPHKRVVSGGTVYFIGRFPEGDYAIHKSHPRDKNGYGGSEISFLLEDGTIETVKGPYSCLGHFDFGTLELCAKLTGIADINNTVSRIEVGKKVKSCIEPHEEGIVYRETKFVLGDWKDRIKQEWMDCGLTAQIHIRGGSRIVKLKSEAAK